MTPITIDELKSWMQQHCYNDAYYRILENTEAFIGYVLKFRDGKYVWYYTEKGMIDVISDFETEEEAV